LSGNGGSSDQAPGQTLVQPDSIATNARSTFIVLARHHNREPGFGYAPNACCAPVTRAAPPPSREK
jgi:hypothetical protein